MGMVECKNSAKLGEKKNMNLPGAIVDLPTLTEKDETDLVDFGLKQGIDMVAASFVRKQDDVEYIRDLLGPRAQTSKLSQRLKIRKASTTTMKSWLPLTASWSLVVISVWRSHPRKSSLHRSG